MDLFAEGFAILAAGAGASTLQWETATRCDCYSIDSEQPQWTHAPCGGLGAIYAPAIEIRALFSGQSRWTSKKVSGEIPHGEAQLSTLDVAHKPDYVDGRIKDRLTITAAADDRLRGRIFYPAVKPTPFIIGNVQRGWRVQLQALEQASRLDPQP